MSLVDRIILLGQALTLGVTPSGSGLVIIDASAPYAPLGQYPQGMDATLELFRGMLLDSQSSGASCETLQAEFDALMAQVLGTAGNGMTFPTPEGSMVLPDRGAEPAGIVNFRWTDLVGVTRDTTYSSVFHLEDPLEDSYWEFEWSDGSPPFPLVIGGNCTAVRIATQGLSQSVNYTFDTFGYAPLAYDPELFCDMVPGCCGGGGIVNRPIMGFVLPLPEIRDPVEERATAPTLETPMTFANHTMELPPFGRGK